MKSKESILKFLLFLLRIILIGVVVGMLVSLFQLSAYYLIEFSKCVFIKHEKIKTIIFFCILPFIILLSVFLTNYNKNIQGGGIPQLEYNLEQRKDKLNWKKDLLMMFVSSLLTFISFATLGSEGPSVVIGGNSALMVNDIFHEKDDESVFIASGAAFGCALNSPLSGFVYAFEDLLHKKNIMTFFKMMIIIFVATIISKIIFSHNVVFFTIETYFQIEDYFIYVPCISLIVVFNFVFANIFLEILMKLKGFYKKHENNLFVKYRALLFYFITIPLAFFLGKYMSSGSMIINNVDYSFTWYVLIVLIIFRIISSVFASTSKISGGIVIPQFAIGFLIGVLIVELYKGVLIDVDITLYENEIIMLSMIAFYVVNMETPLTGISLIFAFVDLNKNNFLPLMLFSVIVMYASNYMSKYNKYGKLYDVLKEYL